MFFAFWAEQGEAFQNYIPLELCPGLSAAHRARDTLRHRGLSFFLRTGFYQ